MQPLHVEPLSGQAFAPFGQVLEPGKRQPIMINDDLCERYHALATVDLAGESPAGIINLFRAACRALPLRVHKVERHPLGSQAFMPLSPRPWLVIVAFDTGEGPTGLRCFRPEVGQGVSINRNTWHGVLTPIEDANPAPQDFWVVDRAGPGANLEEFEFAAPFEVAFL